MPGKSLAIHCRCARFELSAMKPRTVCPVTIQMVVLMLPPIPASIPTKERSVDEESVSPRLN